MIIGLVGEAPTDTLAIENILSKEFSQFNFKYVTLIGHINGSQLDSQKTKRFLRREYESSMPDVVIFIRDLDGIISDKDQISTRKNYFSDNNSVVDKKGIYLLNIYELEALLLADINTLNSFFNTSLAKVPDVMAIEEPKEYLRSRCPKYTITQNAELCALLDFNTLEENCLYFKRFVVKFKKKTGII